ncbi:hypothetical protein GCM10025867_38930 [Frondihabitans sucicola]|uniref:Uncharacterized protein n=1 Tax=Frondihabitans sucicola TaxID=1268041 RepID=A0ABM8GT46_9MICO|nr:hypothetical protein [Frondihabitans sucicola]BDZ51652.1 hypothetical protein GCM10025867_38930 [Frondihabitans sucicola]
MDEDVREALCDGEGEGFARGGGETCHRGDVARDDHVEALLDRPVDCAIELTGLPVALDRRDVGFGLVEPLLADESRQVAFHCPGEVGVESARCGHRDGREVAEDGVVHERGGLLLDVVTHERDLLVASGEMEVGLHAARSVSSHQGTTHRRDDEDVAEESRDVDLVLGPGLEGRDLGCQLAGDQAEGGPERTSASVEAAAAHHHESELGERNGERIGGVDDADLRQDRHGIHVDGGGTDHEIGDRRDGRPHPFDDHEQHQHRHEREQRGPQDQTGRDQLLGDEEHRRRDEENGGDGVTRTGDRAS